MKWIDLSYFYIFNCVRKQKVVPGVEKCLHPDTVRPYQFIEAHITKYKTWPTLEHFKKVFKVNPDNYLKEGYSDQEIIDLLKEEYLRDVGDNLSVKVQKLITSDSVSASDLHEVLQDTSSKIILPSPGNVVRLTEVTKSLAYYKQPISKVCTYGVPIMDRYLGPITKGQYIVIYGAVTEGKSTFARYLAGNISLQSKRALYLSLEESAHDCNIMTAALQAHYRYTDIFDNRIDKLTVKKSIDFQARLKEVGGECIFIDTVETKGSLQTLLELAKQYEPEIFFLDQITLFTTNGSSEEKDITKVTRMLRQFCQETKIPVIALTQRMRGSKRIKDNDEANFDDIGYAASIAQDADIILYVHKTNKDLDTHRKKVSVVKNKKGPKDIGFNFEWNIDQSIIRPIEDFAVEEDHI